MIIFDEETDHEKKIIKYGFVFMHAYWYGKHF